MGWMATACSNEELRMPDKQNRQEVNLTASIRELQTTKADGEDAYPVDGDNFYFIYAPSGENVHGYGSGYKVIPASFQEGVGYAYEGENQSDNHLTWGGLSESRDCFFVLDNFGPYEGTSKYAIGSELDFTGDQFNAGKAPDIPGTGNDLVWGILPVKEHIIMPSLDFQLEHRMSMLTFLIYNENDEEQGLDDKVKVELSNVVTAPFRFRRSDGRVQDNKKPENVEMDGTWEEEEKTDRLFYQTDSWIFPPQIFDVGVNRPRLTITMGGKKYFGTLPESMWKEDGNFASLAFLAGYHLIITVDLVDQIEAGEILFRPVLVKKWKEWYVKELNSYQVGIRTAEELRELITAYNKVDESDRKLVFLKYGTEQDEEWTFFLWSNINDWNTANWFSDDGKEKFKFQCNGYTIGGKTVVGGKLVDINKK